MKLILELLNLAYRKAIVWGLAANWLFALSDWYLGVAQVAHSAKISSLPVNKTKLINSGANENKQSTFREKYFNLALNGLYFLQTLALLRYAMYKLTEKHPFYRDKPLTLNPNKNFYEDMVYEIPFAMLLAGKLYSIFKASQKLLENVSLFYQGSQAGPTRIAQNPEKVKPQILDPVQAAPDKNSVIPLTDQALISDDKATEVVMTPGKNINWCKLSDEKLFVKSISLLALAGASEGWRSHAVANLWEDFNFFTMGRKVYQQLKESSGWKFAFLLLVFFAKGGEIVDNWRKLKLRALALVYLHSEKKSATITPVVKNSESQSMSQNIRLSAGVDILRDIFKLIYVLDDLRSKHYQVFNNQSWDCFFGIKSFEQHSYIQRGLYLLKNTLKEGQPLVSLNKTDAPFLYSPVAAKISLSH